MALIMWSGGVDSTLMLYQLCCAYRDLGVKDRNHDNWPRALSIIHPNVVNSQGEYGPKARERLGAWFKKQGLSFDPLEVTLVHGEKAFALHPGDTGRLGTGGVLQPPIWLTMAVAYLGGTESLYLGYCSTDCFWKFQAKFETAFDALQAVRGATGRIEYPIEPLPKVHVLEEAARLGFLKLTWTCEIPRDGKPCGRCNPCETQWAANALLERRAKRAKADGVLMAHNLKRAKADGVLMAHNLKRAKADGALRNGEPLTLGPHNLKSSSSGTKPRASRTGSGKKSKRSSNGKR